MDQTTENTPQPAAADAPAEGVTSDAAAENSPPPAAGDSEGGEPDAAGTVQASIIHAGLLPLSAIQDARVISAPPQCPPLTRLEEARALPEVDADALTLPCTFVPGTIEAFKDADDRTMRVVCRLRGDDGPAFFKQQVLR